MAFKLRLKDGQHTQNHPDDPNKSMTYYAGQELENEQDLATRWPEKFERADRQVSGPPSELQIRPGESIKDFANRMAALAASKDASPTAPIPVAGSEPTAPPKTREEAAAALNKKTIVELQQLAEEEEIDIRGKTKKEDIVNAILGDEDKED